MTASKPAQSRPAENRSRATKYKSAAVVAAYLALAVMAVARSAIATRLDGFTIDEAYHITAGVSYVRAGDFRLNPEHPPLVKMWVGAWMTPDIFQLQAFRPLQDKNDEREFTGEAVFTINDPARVQARACAAMFALNGLLLLLFAFAVRRVFGNAVALAALGYLAIDPTVAAHMPVVMTDLPVALLSGAAFLLSFLAFRTRRKLDLVLASAALGLALASKHSALITLAAVALMGVVMSLALPGKKSPAEAAKRLATVSLVLMGAVAVLWSFYLFRFSESSEGRDLFNRPLAAKIEDVNSPLIKGALNVMNDAHLLPRAYVWGLADIIRAGVEGRSYPAFAFGRLYYKKGPPYFFAGALAVKLPLGLLALTVIGLGLVVARKVARSIIAPAWATVGLAAFFLIALTSGSTYGGVRHALAVVSAFAVLGAIVVARAIESKSKPLRAAAAVAVVAAIVSAVPVVRPWEYYNELVGGPSNAWLYFNDEGIDLGQRRFELARYYHDQLEPAGEIPFFDYDTNRREMRRMGVRWVGENPEDEHPKSDTVTGTFFVSAAYLAPSLYWDNQVFREATPVARFGNLLVYRGTFYVPYQRAFRLYDDALDALYSTEVDEAKAERLLAESFALDPRAFFVAIELGNLLAKRGAREEAVRAYEVARQNAPQGDEIVEMISRQIDMINVGPPESVPPLRNPLLE